MATLPVLQNKLHRPDLDDVKEVIRIALLKCFEHVDVSVVQCPDLTQPPFNLAAPGLCGKPRISEVGGVRFLIPLANKEKVYDLREIASLLHLPEAYIIGAGAGPHPFVGVNSEMMANIKVGNCVVNGSKISKLTGGINTYVVEKLPREETRFGILMNIFASEGKLGYVLKVKVKRRKGSDNFVSIMRKALANEYGEKPVGMGGVFLLSKGAVKCHVMPDFSCKPLDSESDLEKWLRFFEMPAPMVFFSVFISVDPQLEFRLEHTHGYGDAHGGHYHYDVTPEEVEYEGYFNVAECVYRIDKPI